MDTEERTDAMLELLKELNLEMAELLKQHEQRLIALEARVRDLKDVA